MPPSPNVSNLGWKAFFALLALMQGISTVVLFRTYDAVQESQRANLIQDYKINEVIIPALRIHYPQPGAYPSYPGQAKQAPSSP